MATVVQGVRFLAALGMTLKRGMTLKLGMMQKARA